MMLTTPKILIFVCPDMRHVKHVVGQLKLLVWDVMQIKLMIQRTIHENELHLDLLIFLV